MIRIKGVDPHPSSSLYLTTVYSDMDTTVAKWLQNQLSQEALLVPKRDVIPPSKSLQDYNKMVGDMMEESKTVAKVVALQRSGYQFDVTGQGARVQSLMPASTVEGVLKAGDVVVAAEGQQISAATDLVNLVRRQKPGSTLSLSVQRDGEAMDIEANTKESDSEPGIAVMGILIQTHMFGANLPVQVDIDTENIGGPSAGLMFALGIVDGLDPNGITFGHKIAGTGTLSLDGTVGPIGGIAQKVVGAEQQGAEYFLSPADNYAEAVRATHGMKVVRVEKIDDAITFLKGLQPAIDAPRPPAAFSHLPLPMPTAALP
jgi:Lon-like protease